MSKEQEFKLAKRRAAIERIGNLRHSAKGSKWGRDLNTEWIKRKFRGTSASPKEVWEI